MVEFNQKQSDFFWKSDFKPSSLFNMSPISLLDIESDQIHHPNYLLDFKLEGPVWFGMPNRLSLQKETAHCQVYICIAYCRQYTHNLSACTIKPIGEVQK